MRKAMKLVATFVLAAAPFAAAGPAHAGGGGCFDGVTQGAGTTVRIVKACFTPTILHIDPGETVTWINNDPVVHNITANGWGHFDDFQPLERFSATFDQRGLYPFACTIHPGMSGVIVVGSGNGPGNGRNVHVDPAVALAAPAPVVSADPATGSNGWVVAAAVGVLFGLFAGLGIAAVRRRMTAA
jgi:LPXTG-motif cell wall-anchored protein